MRIFDQRRIGAHVEIVDRFVGDMVRLRHGGRKFDIGCSDGGHGVLLSKGGNLAPDYRNRPVFATRK